MAKHVKNAVKVFVVTLAIVTGAAFILGGMASVTFAGFSSILFGVEVMAIATMSAVGVLVSGLLSKNMDAVSQNFGSKIATRVPANPRPIVYGRCRVGGTITHIETRGTDNNKLQMVVCLAGHEIESLDEVFINDEKLTTTSSGGFQVVTNSRFTNTDNDNNFGSGRLMRFKFKDGSQTSADSTITTACSLTSTDKFINVAYVYIEIIFDSEKFGGGIPPMAFVIKGKKVYDPREAGHSATDSSTWAWSDNPALHVRDYLQDTTYGLKATQDEINDTTNLGGFSAAANTCDSASNVTTVVTASATSTNTVTLTANGNNQLVGVGMKITGTGISGTVTVISKFRRQLTLSSTVSVGAGVTLTLSEVGYTANGFSDMSAVGEGVIGGLLSACAGKMSYVNGKFIMFAGASVTPEMTILDENLLAPLQIITKSQSSEHYNTVKSVFVDASARYIATDTPVFTDTALLNADTPTGESTVNYRKALELQLPFTTTNAMAQRLNKINLAHHRQEVTISALVNIGFMQLQPFDHVYLTNERMGFTQKRFEVLGQKIETIESDDNAPVLATRLDLKEIDPAVYNFLTTDYEDVQEEGDDLPTGDYSVTAPTGLGSTVRTEVDGATVKADIEVSWTNNTDDNVMGTEVAYKLSTDSDYEGHLSVGKSVTKALIPNVVVGKTYNIKVRHFSGSNVFSSYTTAVNQAVSDPTSISAPTNFSASGNKGGILLEWTNPSNTNLRAVKVYRKTTNTTPTNDTALVNTLMGEPNAKSIMFQGFMDGLTFGTTYYFWLRAITHSGTHSSFTSVVSATFNSYGGLDVGLGNVTNHAQIKDDLSNMSIESDLFEIDSGEFKGKTTIKNNQVTLGADGSLSGAGGGQATAVGLGAVKTDLTNAPNTIKNDQVTLAKDGSGNLSLNNAGSGNVSFDNSDVGLGNVTNDAQIKTDGSNAPNALKNNQISLTSSGGTVTLNNANATNKTFTKTDVALGNVTNDAQIKSDGSNAPNILKNDQVTLSKDGSGNLSLTNAGSGNVSFDNSDVGLGNVTNHAQIKTDGSNAPNALKNNQITINSAGVLSNAGGGTVSATGLGAVKTDLTNAPASIKNENTTATDVGLGNVTNDAQVKSDGSNAPNILKNDQITIGLTGTTLSLNNAGSGNQTLGKANVGLSDLASLDSTRSGKLDGVSTGATNNGSTIDSNGNITGNVSVGATMTLGTNSDDKIVVGNITIDGGNGRILITD